MKNFRNCNILLVEDDAFFAGELKEYLALHGFNVTVRATLDDLVPDLRSLQPDILVLDQFVRDQDALTMLPAIRAMHDGGLVILTANQDSTDRVLGLELGADDFVRKTQTPREVLARLRAVIRRTEPPCRPAHETKPVRWVVDAHRREVFAPDGARVRLTALEFATLSYLQARSGETVCRQALSRDVLHRPFTPSDRSVDNMVSRLRTVLSRHVGGERLIQSVRGVGYVFLGLPTDAAD
jgi:DNA-binding response OmpR family regulator